MRFVLTLFFIIFVGFASHARQFDVIRPMDKVEPLNLVVRVLPQESTISYHRNNEFAMVYRSRKNMVKRELLFRIKGKVGQWI